MTTLEKSSRVDWNGLELEVKHLDVSGNLTVSGTTTQTGALTTTAGLTAGQTDGTSYWTCGVVPTLATMGNDTAASNGARWWAEVTIDRNTTVTGIQYLIGSVGGTDKVIVELHSNAGALLGTSALAGVTVGTAANVQAVPFTAPLAVVGPGKYYIALQFNGTTAKWRSHTIPGFSFVTGTVAGTFGTSASITPGTTYTANQGPVAGTY